MKDTKFKKGNTFGKGRPKLSPLAKDIRRKCLEEVAIVIEAISLPHKEAKKMMTSPEASLLMQTIYKAIEKGDRKIVMEIMARFLPRPQAEEVSNSSQVIRLAYSLDPIED